MAEEATKLKETIDEIFKRADEYHKEAIDGAKACVLTEVIIKFQGIESRMEILRTMLHAGHDILPKDYVNQIYMKSLTYPDTTREEIVDILNKGCICKTG